MRGLYKKFLLFFLVAFMAQNAAANEQVQLQNRFLKKIDEVVLIVEDKKLSKDIRNRNIVKALTPMFDFELMAKLSLGNVWKELSSKDAKKFVDLYVERMKN
ncbi:MAG: ABC transporter substrate-binding protein, partial [Sulfurovum sp.]|nr:ABC transporter substrate-binding protein [Sulfurovum sp.]